jgi:hypothetical protein
MEQIVFHSVVRFSSIQVDKDEGQVVLNHPNWPSGKVGISKAQLKKHNQLSKLGIDEVAIRVIEREMPNRMETYWLIFKPQFGKELDSREASPIPVREDEQNFHADSAAESIKQLEPSDGVLMKAISKTGKDTSLGDLVQPHILAGLGLPKGIKVQRFLAQHQDVIFRALSKSGSPSNKNKTESLRSTLELWFNSLNTLSNVSKPFKGYITNESAGNFFGFSPGFPQLILREPEVENGSLAVGIEIEFDAFESKCESDGLTRVRPKGVRSPLPKTPSVPHILCLDRLDIDALRACLYEGNQLLPETSPVAIAVKVDAKVKVQRAKKIFDQVCSDLGLSFVLESKKEKYPKTYEFLQYWALVFQSQNPRDELAKLHNGDWFGSFPIQESLRFSFSWMKTARGRIHDLSHEQTLRGEDRNEEWLLIGDETGSGHELLHADDAGEGVPGSARKNLAYIWVLVPPGVKLPATPSDFHAMDQNSFKTQHIEALQCLADIPQGNCTSFIFKTPNYVEENQRHPRGQKEHIPLLIRNTLPLVIDYIAGLVPLNSTQKIRVMSERIGDAWKPGTDPAFLTAELNKWTSNLTDRGRSIRLTLSALQIHPKMDHPWMNYPDAVGFLTGPEIPSYLLPYKENILGNSITLPYVPSFLGTTYPSLVYQLGENPLLFVEQLVDVDATLLWNFEVPYIENMCMEAFGKFSPVDWRTFNEFMRRNQSRPSGRFIARMVSKFLDGTLEVTLDNMLSDVDRLNMCLTLGWHMDQQGGDVDSILSHVKEDWLRDCPTERRQSWLTLVNLARQNVFDFEVKTRAFVSIGMLERELTTPNEVLDYMGSRPTWTAEEMVLFGQLFTFFAFRPILEKEQQGAMVQINYRLLEFPWEHQRENRRHAIYGAEWALDYARDNPQMFEFAKQRLFKLYEQFLGSGESNIQDNWWWAAAARLYTIGLTREYITTEDAYLQSFLKSVRAHTEGGALMARMRVSAWLIKLYYAMGEVPDIAIYENLVLMSEDFQVLSDVYALTHSSYLLELNQKFNLGDREQIMDDFNARLGVSHSKSQSFFSPSIAEQSIQPKDLLRFNYA